MGESEFLPIRELAKVFLNPAVKSLRSRSLRGLIIPILAEMPESTGLDTGSIQDELDSRYDLKSYPRMVLELELRSQVDDGVLECQNDFWILSQEERQRFQEQSRESESIQLSFEADIVERVEEEKGVLDDHQKIFLKSILDRVIYGIFKSLGDSAIAFATEQQGVSIDVDLNSLISAATTGIEYPVIEDPSGVIEAVSEALRKAFISPSKSFAQGLTHFYGIFLMIRLINADPEMSSLRQTMFKTACLILDTNILVSMLCESSGRHDYTNWLVGTTAEEGVELFVSERTLKEFDNSVEFAGHVIKRDHRQRFSEILLMNEIARTYLLEYRKEMNWLEYTEHLKKGLQGLLESQSIKVIPLGAFEPDAIIAAEARRIIDIHTGSLMEGRPPDLVDHDAYCLLLVQDMRESEPHHSLCSPWFLTHHVKLLRADKYIRKRWNLERESAIGPEVWFEMLYPFLGPDIDKSHVSIFFSKMVAENIVPVPPVSVRDFLRYVSAEIDLSEKDEADLYDVIEKRHLENVLGERLAEGDFAATIDLLFDAVSDTLRMEKRILEKTDIIERLVDKNKELGNRIEEIEESFQIDVQTLQENIAQVESAATNDEKKKTLEGLGEYLFEGVSGWKVVEKDRRTPTSELDLIIENTNRTDSFLTRMGSDIPVECKNWNSPVGANEIRDFGRDIQKRRFSYGILVSKQGVTGNPEERSFAHNEIWDLFRDGTTILVLSLDDIAEVAKGRNLISVLRTKNREIRLMG